MVFLKPFLNICLAQSVEKCSTLEWISRGISKEIKILLEIQAGSSEEHPGKTEHLIKLMGSLLMFFF